ncbi:MAG TPA: hypothetical protein VFL76_00920 [Edaphocola sp.]|nr:hypothetical protein [Edaphocola sp.]
MAGKGFIFLLSCHQSAALRVLYCVTQAVMLFAARFLAAVRAAISLPQSKPRIKATAIALRHPAALHRVSATCAPARSCWFSAAAQSPPRFCPACPEPVEGQANASLLCFACF